VLALLFELHVVSLAEWCEGVAVVRTGDGVVAVEWSVAWAVAGEVAVSSVA